MQHYSLSELTEQIKDTLNSNFDSYYWVKAEISQIKVNYSGHAYLQLIEKSEIDDTLVANIRAIIWSNKYNILSTYFTESTGTSLVAGIKILVKVEISFHNVYGLSLVIHDIDPTYTLGDFAKKRQEIIEQLKKDGVLDLNKNLEFPLVPQRVAVISSYTAAGYADFTEHILNNEYSYNIHIKLFKAVMQGEKTEQSIISELNKIAEEQDNFDVVAIIRGGGAKIDLSAFDSYNIAANIAQFPLPVITGIGHQIDLSIADMVAYKSVKTPTAAADFIIQKIADFEFQISELFDRIVKKAYEYVIEQNRNLHDFQNNLSTSVNNFIYNANLELSSIDKKINTAAYNKLNTEKSNLLKMSEKISYILKLKIESEKNNLKNLDLQINNSIKDFIEKNKKQLDQIELILENNDPKHILKLGYTITRKDGKVVKNPDNLKANEIIETTFSNSTIKSKIIKK